VIEPYTVMTWETNVIDLKVDFYINKLICLNLWLRITLKWLEVNVIDL
jgi:hypothetical protein